MIVLMLLSAQAQELPATTCDVDSDFCQIHKDRLATLVGKANAIPDLRAGLNAAADRIDDLADELEKSNAARDEDGTSILELTEQNTVLQESSARAKRQRNVAYVILGGSVAAMAGGVYLGAKL